ncbi:MAG: shikimate kinase AroK [bacterium]
MQRIFLIGPMGSGKTTLGRLIASSLRYDFADSDKEIEDKTGVSIPTIFDYEGEDGFREREIQAIDELTQRDRIVLATGGGAVIRPENRISLHERGFVVYLKVSVHVQLMRTSRDKNRPLLQTSDPRSVLKKLAAERAPLYEEAAHFSIHTDHIRARTLKSRIIKAYNQHLTQQKPLYESNTNPQQQDQ